MWRLGLVVFLGAATASAAPRASNPAFLGIQMHDAGRGCAIDNVTHGSPAEAAALAIGDVVIALDDKPLVTCAELLDEITSRAPGDAVQLRLEHRGAALMVQVQLSTRDAPLHRVIGKPMVETNLIDVEDGATYDLSAPRGSVEIVGLYDPRCVDCAQLFSRFLDWSHDKARRGGPPVLVLAVAVGEPLREPRTLQKSLDVPLATGLLVASAHELESSPFSSEPAIADRDRLGVIVIDGRGTVQYVGPIAPNSDDTEAALDELFAAADQARRCSK